MVEGKIRVWILSLGLGILFVIPALAGDMVLRGPSDRRVVALTFDDGPNYDGSTDLLDILYKYGVRATFFVIGEEAEKNPDVVHRMNDFGHEVGNHTYSHTRLGDVSITVMEDGVKRTNSLIESITGERPRCFRPPGGSTSAPLSANLEGQGMRTIGWTIKVEDFTEFNENFEIEENYHKIAEDLKAKVLAEAKPGAIVLLHNGSKQTILALPGIIEGLRAEGYGFVTVSELLEGEDI